MCIRARRRTFMYVDCINVTVLNFRVLTIFFSRNANRCKQISSNYYILFGSAWIFNRVDQICFQFATECRLKRGFSWECSGISSIESHFSQLHEDLDQLISVTSIRSLKNCCAIIPRGRCTNWYLQHGTFLIIKQHQQPQKGSLTGP